jgi:RND family efflux transporter MFP subunit
MRNIGTGIVVAPLFLLGLLVTAGCTSKGPEMPAPRPPEVLVSVPVTKEITDHEDFTGQTESVAGVAVRARATGYLRDIHFKDGSYVKKGQLLFEIDDRPYEAELRRAEFTVKQAESRLKRLETEFKRAERLREKNAISLEEFEKAASDRNEAQASLGIAKATRDLAKLNVEFTMVTAPIGGRASRRFVDPGNLVKADETILTTIGALEPLYVYFDLDERTVLRFARLIEEGKIKSVEENEIPLLIGTADEEGFSHQGKLNFVDNKIDTGTGTLRVRGVVENRKQSLFPGLFVRVRVLVGEPRPAILIAERALQSDQGQKYVYVVDDKNEVAYRPVKVGALQNGLRVIDKGIAPGEKVVVNGLQRIRPKMKVDPKMVDMPMVAEAKALSK